MNRHSVIATAITNLSEHAPLCGNHGDKHRQTHRTHSVTLQEGHQVTETKEHHDLDAGKHIVNITKVVVSNEVISAHRSEDNNHQNLPGKQNISCPLEIVLNGNSNHGSLLLLVLSEGNVLLGR